MSEFILFSKDNITIDEQLSQLDTNRIKTCLACGKQFPLIGKYPQRKYCSREHYAKCMICGKEYPVDLAVGLNYITRTCSKECSAKHKSIVGKEYNRLHPKPKAEPKPVEYEEVVCAYCGKPFTRKTTQTMKYCSDECRRQGTKSELAKSYPKRKCILCGKEFQPINRNHVYCEGPHYRDCPVCGKQIPMKWLSDYMGACSEECTQKMRQQKCMGKYGVPFSSQNFEIREKLRRSSKIAHAKRKEYLLATRGVVNDTQLPEVREKISNTLRSKAYQDKFKAANMEKYGVEYPMQNRDVLIKQTTSAKRHTTLDGTRVDSSYEQCIYDFLIRNHIDFTYQVPIEYDYNGKTHVTFVDFQVGDMLFEVKGGHLLGGCYDYNPANTPIDVKLAIYKKHHVIIITDYYQKSLFGKPNSTESNGLKYLDKCPEPLIGVDIDLFRDPKFPFSPDRPPIFYQVKVSGSKSSYEAFFDENIRWKMILNRINYAGGFISNHEVLTAMNVTRTCKQPSWFSKTLAKRIIETYCTSDIIVDPFAGWGTRADASTELGLTYLGVDLNRELVDWHIENNRSIQYGDAREFKYEGECSVFICPPYQDVEVYFEGQDTNLTQCEWLQIVMKNVPNAKEYVMVCKIVDKGWEQYEVDSIKNQSHFGTNYQHILVVPNMKV